MLANKYPQYKLYYTSITNLKCIQEAHAGLWKVLLSLVSAVASSLKMDFQAICRWGGSQMMGSILITLPETILQKQK